MNVDNRDFRQGVFQILNDLHRRDPAKFKTYAHLALAIAVVYDLPPPPYWPHGQVPPDRRLERLVGLQVAAGERPGAGFGLAGALPQERVQLIAANSQDDGERNVGRMRGGFQP